MFNCKKSYTNTLSTSMNTMEHFFPNQRYTSKGEPELGVGVLTEISKGKVQLFFSSSNVYDKSDSSLYIQLAMTQEVQSNN